VLYVVFIKPWLFVRMEIGNCAKHIDRDTTRI
jgi:hypothetical protein